MNIKNQNDKFDFKSDKDTIIKVFSSLSKYKSLNYSDVSYIIKALIKINSNDLNFILEFLREHNFIIVRDEIGYLNFDISEIEIFELFKKHVLSQLYKIDLLRYELFNVSKFIVLDDDILIETNSIPISYRQYFQILENINLITNHSDLAYKKVLDFGLGEILLNRPLRKISILEFEKIQKQKQIKGEKAEKFVFELELEKLKNSNYNPIVVSEENITLGYDIKSYNTEGEEMFIEVKALTDSFSFFWSNNEIDVSKLLNERYYLYCVKFEKGEPDCIYMMYKDPYKQIVLDKIVRFRQIGDLEVFIKN